MPVIRKTIYTIGILMFLSGPLHPWTGLAADNGSDKSCNVINDPGCRLTSRLEYALRGKENEGLDWGNSFGENNPEKIGQNLYLLIYKNTQTDTMDEAITATAAQYGLPPDRMSLILGGDIRPIMDRSPSMRIEDAVKIYNQMIATYNDRKNSADLNATISAKIIPNEMFADGDLDNSGFDLINDLNNIEIILFQRNDLVSFGGALGGGDGGEEAGQAASPLQDGTSQSGPAIPIDLDGTGTASGSGQPGDKPGQEAAAKVENPFKALAEDKSALLSGGGINPNQCFPLTDLDQVLDQFAAAANSDPRLKSSFVKDSGAGAADGAASGTSGAGATTGSGGAGATGGLQPDVPLPGVPPTPLPDVAPAPAGDYTTPPICDDIVCVSIDFVEAPATASFQKTDNCIQCHVQYINESMQKTIAHSLIPAKATGNLGESGLCKNAAGTALGAVGMNISLNLVPIITPSKDDLVTLGTIGDEWDKYEEKYGFWNYGEKQSRQAAAAASGKPEDKSPIMSETQRLLEIEIVNAPDGTTQADIMAKTSQAYDAVQSAQTQEMLVLEIAKDAYSSVDSLKALDDEMKAMNTYFDGFRKLILTLLEDVPGLISSKACVKLNSKQACT